MYLPVSLKSCRARPSPAIRSSSCRSTPQLRTTCRGFACSAFRRDRSKKNSKRCSSKANEETQQNCDRTARNENVGAGEGNRTLVFSLEGCCSTIELPPRTRSPITPGRRPQPLMRRGCPRRFLRKTLFHQLLRAGSPLNRRRIQAYIRFSINNERR